MVRDEKTQERTRPGDDLYGKVSSLSSTGKSLFVNTNEAKCNDYIMDPGGNGSEETSNPPNSLTRKASRGGRPFL